MKKKRILLTSIKTTHTFSLQNKRVAEVQIGSSLTIEMEDMDSAMTLERLLRHKCNSIEMK